MPLISRQEDGCTQTDSALMVCHDENHWKHRGKRIFWLRKMHNMATVIRRKYCNIVERSNEIDDSEDSSSPRDDQTGTDCNSDANTTRYIPHQQSYKLETSTDDCFGYLQCEEISLQEAEKKSKETGKPVFRVHAENGHHLRKKDLFSHPLIVEALDSLFITVASKEQDSECLSIHLEGESCSSLIRITNHTGSDLVPPICIFSATEWLIVDALVQSLEKLERNVPQYLRLLSDEFLQKERSHQVIITVYDPVLAEVDFAGMQGTIQTEAGYLENREKAVKVVFDPEMLRINLLARYVFAMANCTGKVFCQTNEERMAVKVEAARSTDQGCGKIADPISDLIDQVKFMSSYELKANLRRTPMRFVPLTDLQCTKANRLIYQGKFHEATHLLSPRQGLILMEGMRIKDKRFHDVVGIPIRHAWQSICNETCPRSCPPLGQTDTDSCTSE